MRKVSIYARTSMADQNTDTQISALRGYCERMGFEIEEEYVDSGFSGKTDKRPITKQLAVGGCIKDVNRFDRRKHIFLPLLNL